MLKLETFVCGPIENNVYLLFDDQTRDGWIIDPAMNSDSVSKFTERENIIIKKILITHAHFDHYYGLSEFKAILPPIEEIVLGKDDLHLWNSGGGAKDFFGKSQNIADPNILVDHQQKILLDDHVFEVRAVPGHTQGSVLYYCPEINSAFCGDLIFFHGVGRTDLPGGSFDQLVNSIRTQVFTLPPPTKIFPGHGPATTVAEEIHNNPFI